MEFALAVTWRAALPLLTLASVGEACRSREHTRKGRCEGLARRPYGGAVAARELSSFRSIRSLCMLVRHSTCHHRVQQKVRTTKVHISVAAQVAG